jgi:hypothetical protein
MKFEVLQRRVRRAEAVVQVRSTETLSQWNLLNHVWRRAWTPGRIVIAGLAGGFAAGKLEPGGAFSGGRWLQMIGLVASAQASVASFAAAAAGMAAQQASAAADDAGQAAETAASTGAAAADPVQPRAAEAATDVSES